MEGEKKTRIIEHIEIDEYADLDSSIHNWDPRVKLISIFSFIVSLVLLDDLKYSFVGLLVAFLLVYLSKIPFRFVLGRLKWIVLFTLFFFVILPFTVPGNEMARLNSVKISYEGVNFALLMSFRVFSATLLVFSIFSTTKFNQVIRALDKLKVPNKLVQVFMFAYRYIFVLADEFERMLTSLESRGFEMKTNLRSMKTLGKGVGMLFVKSWERAERVYSAMVSRGYSGYLKTLSKFEMSKRDLLKAFSIIMVAIALHVISLISAT